MPRVLGMATDPADEFVPFELVHGRKGESRAEASTQKEVETSKLTEYINECLSRYKYELSDDDAESLATIVGEVITNAEEHSGKPFWWMAGYLRQPTKLKYGDGHITIFNFGNTIYESLRQLPDGSRLRREIASLVQQHRQSRFFMPARWTEEALWTLYALQEAVSRHNDQDVNLGHRGMGTVRMIQFFHDIGQSSVPGQVPKMCLVSGRTHITFDGTFAMRPETLPSGQVREIIAFNADNDLRQPPSPTAVRVLPIAFPGTLLSLRFFLDTDHLKRLP